MTFELLIFIAMLATFLITTFGLKFPVSIAMMLAAMIGALVGGEGLPLRHLVEGTFSYVDTILVISTAMIFMKVIERSGALDAISSSIIKRFHNKPALLLILIMIVIMFPGMITGSSTAAVLSAGSIMGPVLVLMGVPVVETASIIAMGGILGMIAPPVNVPAMIIGGGVDIPYVGFGLPLVLLTFPLAIVIVLYLGLKHVRDIDYTALEQELNFDIKEKHGIKIYIPIIVSLVLMLVNKVIPAIPDIGMPMVFFLSAIVGVFTGEKVNFFEEVKLAIKDVLPVLGILMGVGMFIQIMTLTGVRGYVVTTALSLPSVFRYLAMIISIPAFGAVSAYGSASVLGVPFLLAFMGKDQIVTAAAISLITSVGDMVPPTALAGIFAAQVMGIENYTEVLKKSFVPTVMIIIVGLLFVVFAGKLAPYIVL